MTVHFVHNHYMTDCIETELKNKTDPQTVNFMAALWRISSRKIINRSDSKLDTCFMNLLEEICDILFTAVGPQERIYVTGKSSSHYPRWFLAWSPA